LEDGGLAESLARLLLNLCAVPSPTGQEGRLCDGVQAALEGSAFQVRRLGNGLAARGPAAGRPLVTLFGHLDTVPAAEAGPYQLKDGDVLPAWREGDRLHGLGSSDMKGGLVLMLALANGLPLDELPCELGLVFYDREEGPYDENGLEDLLEGVDWLQDTALGILLEPSQSQVQLGCLGGLHALVRLQGKSAHSARPWQGENAIHKAAGLLNALEARAPRQAKVGGLVFSESLSATMARGGRYRNVVPERFDLNLNFRFAPDRSLEQAEAYLRSFVEAAAPGALVHLTDRAPAGAPDAANPLVQRFLQAAGGEPQPKLGWTDVARLAQRGIPCLNYGPGLSAQAHQAHEHALLSLLVESYHSLWTFLAGPWT